MTEPPAQDSTKSTCGRHLLSSSYKSFDPIDIGDRYVHFLLENEPTLEKLNQCVLTDHITRNNAEQTRRDASIEVDAFQLINLDPILGNLTLRYPDTLLPLLEDSTVQARQVLKRRIEQSIKAALKKSEHQSTDNNHPQGNLHQLLSSLQNNKQYEPRPLHARLVHLPPHHQCCKPSLSSLHSTDVGTVIQIHGTCVRTSPIRMMETIRTYKCLQCGCVFEMNADFGTANNILPCPVICPSSNNEGDACQGTNFAMVEGASCHVDYQEMKVQESVGATSRVGSVPRSLLVKMTDDLVDRCNPGDEVVVVGSLHAEWQNGGLGKDLEVMVGMSMQAHSVRVVNVDEGVANGGGSSSLGLNDMSGSFGMTSGNLRERFRREFDAFWSEEEAKKHPIGTRDYILRAVCPKLYGMHAVKLGMLLALIGGATVTNQNEFVDLNENSEDKKEPNDLERTEEAGPVAFQIGGGDIDDSDEDLEVKPKRAKIGADSQGEKKQKAVRSRRRTQSHILLIGDPGTGKSQFLRFAAALSPRSVLTTGTGSSRAGLTCAAVKDSGNEFSLEAGALALADRGVCCIDEFGCMSKEDRTSIHEAMEQQTISVAKAGIVCKLNARATVVAVMNPTGGIYNPSLSLENNSRLGSALLSRFDIIFIMMDQADIGRDEKIAHFLLQQSITPGSGYDRPLAIEKNLSDGDTNGHWSMEKLRAYIAIVRDRFHPTLSPEASELLQNHYDMCRQSNSSKSLPITVRFLESLIRLSQAHARLMYRNEVLEDDAVAVILLMGCTATAYQNEQCPHDDFMFQNPIDTPFNPFDSADDDFHMRKEEVLAKYRCGNQDISNWPSFTPNHHTQTTRTDQTGRRYMSQMTQNENVAQPPFELRNRSARKLTNPSSSQLDEVRHTMSMIHQQYEPSPPSQNMYEYGGHAPHSQNDIAVISQNRTQNNDFLPDLVRSHSIQSHARRGSSDRKHRRSAD